MYTLPPCFVIHHFLPIDPFSARRTSTSYYPSPPSYPHLLSPPRQSLRQFCHSFATFFRPIPILARRRTSLLLLLLLRFIGYYIGILYITRSVQHDKSPQQWRLPSLLERLVRSREVGGGQYSLNLQGSRRGDTRISTRAIRGYIYHVSEQFRGDHFSRGDFGRGLGGGFEERREAPRYWPAAQHSNGHHPPFEDLRPD